MHSSPSFQRLARSVFRSSLVIAGAIVSAALLVPTHPASRETAKAAIPLPISVRASEEAFAKLSIVVPSSAGFFYDRAGNLVVWVSDIAETKAAPVAILGLLASHAIELGPEKSRVPSIVIRVGSFSFRQLAAWRDSVSNYVDNHADAGVTSLDLDEAANRITVGVLPQTPQGQLLSQFEQFGIDPGAINFRISERMRFDVGPSVTRIERFRAAPSRASGRRSILNISNSQSTMIGGLGIGVRVKNSGGAYAKCTNGFVVQHYQSGVTKTGLLIASHCTENIFGADHDTVEQTFGTANFVGVESHDPDDYNCGIWECRPSDAAFVETNAGVSVALGQIAKFPGIPYTLFTYDNTSSWVITQATSGNVYVGTITSWVGDSTGYHDSARVTNTCTDMFVESGYKLTCGMVDTVASAGGDSGGPVWVASGIGNEVTAVGTVSGHPDSYHMVWSQISRAITDFSSEGATLNFVTMTISPPDLSGSVDGNNQPVLTWTSVSGALAYTVYRYYYDNSCFRSGPQYIGHTTATSLTDGGITLGGGGTCPSVEYWVTASTATAYSGPSSTVTFTGVVP